MPKSQWRPIPRFPGYQINGAGAIRSFWPPDPDAPMARHPRPMPIGLIRGVAVVSLRSRATGRTHAATVTSLLRESFPERREAPAC